MSRTLACLFVAITIVAGCSRQTTVAVSSARQVGAFRIAVQNRPARPVVGENRLTITLLDAASKPVTGATLGIEVVMEAMGTMPRMLSRGKVKEMGAGVYEAEYSLGMAGEWDVLLSVRTTGVGEATATWRLSTSTSELAFLAGTPPAGGDSGPAAAGAGTVAGGDIPGFGPVLIDASRLQAIGVRTAVVAARPLKATIRAAGKVAYDETRRAEVSLKFAGWVRSVHVDYTGRVVRSGEPLISVYSPELFAAQQEFLGALKGDGAAVDLAGAARQRLRLWDIAPETIDAIAASGKPLEAVPIVAPISGVVIEKNVVQGSSFQAGQVLYKLAPIHPVWVLASVYQYELSLVRPGMTATIETPFLPERTRTGRVSTVNPYLDPSTRTGEVRVTVPNARGELKPGMFVDVTLERELGSRLAIPASAVLYEGDSRIVFVDAGDGRLVPRRVALGPKAGDDYAVDSGLAPGEVIVVSGNFMVAAESRLRAPALNP
jgi:Cu(I)/Ag(I) efflux system membrane fusion protein